MRKHKKVFLCLILSCMLGLSGCRMIVGDGLFGEIFFSEDEAQEALENVKNQIQTIDFSKYAFSIEVDEDKSECYDIYQTECYVVAYAGEKDEYLWYQDYLYACVEEKIYYNQVSWEEIGWKELLDDSQTFILQLIEQEGELTYKKVPMAGENSYLLTVDYPMTEYVSEGRDVYPTLRIWVDQKCEITSIILSWNEPGIEKDNGFYEGRSSVTVAFKPYENAIDYQAERKIWFFAHDYGLVEEGVPSLNTQEDDREYCEGIINKIDFASARDSWQHDEKLRFPEMLDNGDITK